MALPNGGNLQCRIAFASTPYAYPPVWTDVSADLISIKTNRGRQNQLDRFEAGNATIVLKNLAGNYWENNTGGAYYPNVKLDKRVNLRVADVTVVGYNTGGVIGVSAVDIIWSVKLTPSVDCTVRSFFVFTLVTLGTTGHKIKGALYNSALNLLQSAAEITPADLSWNKLTLAADVHLDAGRDYWFSVWADVTTGDVSVPYTAGAANQMATDALAYGAWPNPYVPDSYSNTKLSLYFNPIYDLYTGFIRKLEPFWFSKDGQLHPGTRIECADLQHKLAKTTKSVNYSQELSGTRAGNVLTSAGWNSTERAIDAGVELMQASGAVSINAMSHLFTVQESETSQFWMRGDGYARYLQRGALAVAPYTTVQGTFGTGFLPIHEPDFPLDDDLFYNEVRLTRTGGSQQVVDEITEAVISSLSRSGLLLTSDALTLALCQYLLARHLQTKRRIKSFTVKPQTPGQESTLWPLVLGLDIGSRVRLVWTEALIDGQYIIEGIESSYDFQVGLWVTKYRCSDAAQLVTAQQVTIRPDAAGDLSETIIGGSSPAGTRWESVDEVTADEDVTYVKGPPPPAAPGGQQIYFDSYNLAAPPVGAIITKVSIKARAKYTVTMGVLTMSLGVRIGSTNYVSGYPEIQLTTSYADYSYELALNPATGLAWHRAEVVALQAVIGLYGPAWSDTGEVRCTQVWAVVDYIAAA